jgi:DNA-binding PadR family transcriptional regulator
LPEPTARTDAFLPLPDLHFHVLLALAEGAAHGWAVIKRIRTLAQRRSPSSGSLYLAMLRLEERGLIAESGEAVGSDGDGRRRYYALTDLGRAVMRAEAARLAELVAAARRVDGGAGAVPVHEGRAR